MNKDIDFQVIIASYNRKDNIVRLVNSIKSCDPKPTNIIVVDATADENKELKSMGDVQYFHDLRHRNQPYQRLVGALASKSDYIIFMDDDLEILDKEIFGKLLKPLKTKDTVAVTASIKNESYPNPGPFVSSIAGKIALFLSGLPFARPGKMGLVGHTGKIKKQEITKTEFLHGPIMGFKRSVFLKLPDAHMLSLFDQQMLIPEDKILSIRALRYGNLLYFPETLVRHPKVESTYFKNLCDYTARVHFSRFIINIELVKNRSKYLKNIYSLQFWYYSLWRKTIALTRSIFEPKVYYQKFKGFRMAEHWVKQYLRGEIMIQESIIDDAKIDASF